MKPLVCARIVLALLLLAAGVVCVVLRGFGMRFTGFLCLGCAAALVLSVALGQLALYGLFWRVVRGVFYGALCVGLAAFCVLEAQVLRAENSEICSADAAIVLGAGVRGTQPSLALQSRLEVALAFAEANPASPIVLSGGQGYGEDISEAECMRRYLTARGVPPEQLILEDRSTDTAENFRFSKDKLTRSGVDTDRATVAVISNDFHLCRAAVLARREGLHPVGIGAPVPWLHLEVNYTIREAFALAKTYLPDRR